VLDQSRDRPTGDTDVGQTWRGFRQCHERMYTSWADSAVQRKKIPLI
jgi:hypothetical protein